MKRRVRILLIPTVLAALALVNLSCGGDDENPMNPPPAGGADVTITIAPGSSQAGANAYSPNPANVQVGQTVQWVNNDAMLHTATATGGAFDQSMAPSGGRSQIITMSTAGSFNYICTVSGHTMSGTLNVAP